MRLICTTFLFFLILSLSAQKTSTFKEVLKTAPEISIADSLLINYFSLEKAPLDFATGESFFKLIYRNEKQPSLRTEFFIAGKITSHKNFDILILCAEREVRNQSNDWVVPINRSISRDLYFVLLDKEGNYKNSFLSAMNYENINYFQKTIMRKISSCIYKDFKIVQQVESESKPANLIIPPIKEDETKKMNFSMEYHINDYGVFVAYPKFKSN